MVKNRNNKMATHAVEATGLRMIGMYVQEYFHWGWQPYGQENDDGIDGEIIPRFKNGQDMGVRIKVQSKSGPGYLSSMNEKTVNIHPYSNKERLAEHIRSWNRSNEPVILVYTNAEKINKIGNKYLDLKNPKVWWMRMDDYVHDGTSLIKIPRGNLFQEHTKGELLKIIKPFIKDWVNYPVIKPEREDLMIWNSLNILNDGRRFYDEWKLNKPMITINDKQFDLKVSRTGWRHIINKSRKDRVPLSLKLLPIARKILERTNEIRPIILRSRETPTTWDSTTVHVGFRSRVEIEGFERKVQVVLKWYKNIQYNKEKIWFYSVHIIK